MEKLAKLQDEIKKKKALKGDDEDSDEEMKIPDHLSDSDESIGKRIYLKILELNRFFLP